MRIGLRHYLLDAEDALYHLPNAAFDRLLCDPEGHRLCRFAGQRIRSAEIAVALMHGKLIAVERASFGILTFIPGVATVGSARALPGRAGTRA